MKKEIKIDGRKVVKTVGTGLKFAAGIGASKLTKDILNKAVSESISKNVFVQIGMYAVAGYVGSKAAEYIEGKVNGYIEIINLYVDTYADLKKNADENDKAVSESISKNVFVQIGMYAVAEKSLQRRIKSEANEK